MTSRRMTASISRSRRLPRRLLARISASRLCASVAKITAQRSRGMRWADAVNVFFGHAQDEVDRGHRDARTPWTFEDNTAL
jgi:hypothetical protein